MKKLIIILCAFVASLGLISCGSSNTPSGVVKEYYKALSAGKYEKAVSMTTMTDQENIKGYAQKLEGAGYKVSSYEILSEEIAEDGENAVVEVKITTSTKDEPTPKEETKRVRLKKMDGKWRIHL